MVLVADGGSRAHICILAFGIRTFPRATKPDIMTPQPNAGKQADTSNDASNDE